MAVDSIANAFTQALVAPTIPWSRGYSYNGKPIVALPSLSINGNSNILFTLPAGSGVTITRVDVHYVITEYGTAFLFGKAFANASLALIDIAHPKFGNPAANRPESYLFTPNSRDILSKLPPQRVGMRTYHKDGETGVSAPHKSSR